MRESHRRIAVADIVIVHNDAHPRGLWKLGKVENLITGADGHIRGAVVRVLSSGRNTTMLKRPVQRLYTLEVQAENGLMAPLPQDTPKLTSADSANLVDLSQGNTPAELVNVRQRRKAFTRA